MCLRPQGGAISAHLAYMNLNWPPGSSGQVLFNDKDKVVSEEVLVDRQNIPSKAKESEDNRNVTSK